MGTTCVSRPPPRGPPDEEWQGPDPLEGHQLRSMAMAGEDEDEAEGGGDSVADAADGAAARTAARNPARIAQSDATLASRAARASRTATAAAAAAAAAAAPVGARAADATLEEMGAAGASGDVEGEGETVRALTRAATKMMLDAGPE